MFDVPVRTRARKIGDRRLECAVPVGTPMSLSAAVVLVIEDSPVILMNAIDIVEAAGFEAVGVANAE